MHIYLPIAGQAVNAVFIILLGFGVGVLSGMFGVGGGFLTTPLLIFYGIPPTVAVARGALVVDVTRARLLDVAARHLLQGGEPRRGRGIGRGGGSPHGGWR